MEYNSNIYSIYSDVRKKILSIFFFQPQKYFRLVLGPNSYNESETIAKYEIMDGAPVRGKQRKSDYAWCS